MLPRLEPGRQDTPRCVASVECSDLRPCIVNSRESRRLVASAPACDSPDAWRRSPARSTLPASFTTMASDARAEWRDAVKRGCRLAWIGGAPDLPGVDRGAGASLRCAAVRPKNGRAENRTVTGGHWPAGRTGRKQPTRHIPGHPHWLLLLHCRVATPTDRQPRHRPPGSGPSCPFQRCRSVAARQSSLHPGRVRSGEGTATGRHLGRHAVVRINVEPGGSTPGLQIRSRQRSPRSPRVPDMDWFSSIARIVSPRGNLLLTRFDRRNNRPA